MNVVRVGVAAVVVRDGALLVLRRAGSHGAGKLSVPGGHQEVGESPEQTAEREMAEETGIEVRAVGRMGFTDDPMPEINKHYITLYIRCEWVSGEPKIMEPDRASEMGWMTIAELMAHSDEVFEPLLRFLEEFRL